MAIKATSILHGSYCEDYPERDKPMRVIWWAYTRYLCLCGKRHVQMLKGFGEIPNVLEATCKSTKATVLVEPWTPFVRSKNKSAQAGQRQ